MVELRLLNNVLKISAVILFISGILDIVLYLVDGYEAPSWVLGILWITLAFMFMAFTGGVLDVGSE